MRKLARDLRALPVALICTCFALPVGSGALQAGVRRFEVSFPTEDGGEIHAFHYGSGDHGVVLAHGMVFDKESWAPLAPRLAEAGLQVLAIDFRGYGKSEAGTEGEKLYLDILGAMSFLKSHGATRVSLLGASMGGGAVGRAAVLAEPGEIDRLVLLAPVAVPKPGQMHAGQITYISAQGDPSIARTRNQYEQAPEPKTLEVLPGQAHAQHIFKTEQSDALVELIVGALVD